MLSQRNEEAIFHAARALDSPEERSRFLDRECGEDQALRARVEALLDVYLHDPEFLRVAPGLPDETSDFSVDEAAGPSVLEQPGDSIGPYKLREQLGEGGMGVVYVAEQSKPVSRRVALKVIKPGMDSKQVIARFEAERQALAMMDHPNIARVLDAGTTSSGLPYFAMDLVRGLPIVAYCDKYRLNTAARTELFLDVCDAVQHAHQKGIIHRDLKPSNVLVTRNGERAIPKVIDFGLAKATGQRLTDKTVYTNLYQMIGTPLYMSPEQAELSELDVDTRSDVYSLGVILYEMFTGSTPHDRTRLSSKGYDEIRRVIREEDPPRPSHRISTLDAKALTTLCEQRRTDAATIRHHLSGDLDWIVMKALEKDRSRRYQSPRELGEDLQRFLAGEPVEARPPSVGYRLRKYVRKHRLALATAGLVLGALLSGLVGTSVQAVRAGKAEADALAYATDAKAERDAAERQRQEAIENFDLATQAVDQLLAEVANSDLANTPQAVPACERIIGRAVDFYEALARRRPDDVSLRLKLFEAKIHHEMLLKEMNRNDPAMQDIIAQLEEMLAQNPRNTAIAQLLMIVLNKSGHTDKRGRGPRGENFERSVAIGDSLGFAKSPDKKLRRELADSLWAMSTRESPEQAIATLNRAAQIEASSRDAENYPLLRSKIDGALGRRLIQLGKIEDGVRSISSAMQELEAKLFDTAEDSLRPITQYVLMLGLGASSNLIAPYHSDRAASGFESFLIAASRLMTKFPSKTEVRCDLGDYLLKRVTFLLAERRTDEAATLLQGMRGEFPAESLAESELAIRWVERTSRALEPDDGAGPERTGVLPDEDVEQFLGWLSLPMRARLGWRHNEADALFGYLWFATNDLAGGTIQLLESPTLLDPRVVDEAIVAIAFPSIDGEILDEVAPHLQSVSSRQWEEGHRSPIAGLNLAAATALSGDCLTAREMLDRVLEPDQDSQHVSDVAKMFSIYHYVPFDTDVARELSERVRLSGEIDDKTPPGYHSALGMTLYRAGEHKEALAALEKSLDEKQVGFFNYCFLSMVHHQLGNPRQAESYLNKSIQAASETTYPVAAHLSMIAEAKALLSKSQKQQPEPTVSKEAAR